MMAGMGLESLSSLPAMTDVDEIRRQIRYVRSRKQQAIRECDQFIRAGRDRLNELGVAGD